MKTSSSLRWVGWLVLASLVTMILSITFNIIAVSNGSLIPGARSHSVLVETFDTLTTGFLIPLPFALYLIYRAYAPRLSLVSMLLGASMLIGVTILHLLFVLEVMWFIDSLGYYAMVAIGLCLWLIIIAYLAYRSRKPAQGTLLHLLGATLVGFPVWEGWLGYLLASGKLTDQP
jgi:hypothetical protein